MLAVTVVLAIGAADWWSRAGRGPADEGPPMVHVHGLDAAPDGQVYAATHYGLFRVGEGAAQRVGERFPDLMGFTVTDDGEFLASGHPDLLEGDAIPEEGLFGLVRSDDGAVWTPVSLLGDADLHIIDVAHGRVWGYDSTGGRLLVTADRQNWDERSRIPLLDFAVSPDDAELLVGLDGRSVLRSTDGGRTWQPVEDAEPYALLHWRDDRLVAVTPAGRVDASTDGGVSWQAVGDAGGTVEALGDDADGRLLAAVHGRGIVRSRNGASWEVLAPAELGEGSHTLR